MTFNEIQNEAAVSARRLGRPIARRIATFVAAKAAYILLLLGLRPGQMADRQGLFLFAAGPQFAETESRLAEWAAGAPTYLMEAIFIVSTLQLLLGRDDETAARVETAAVARGALYVGAVAGLALTAMAGSRGPAGLLLVIALQCFLDVRLMLLWPILALQGRFDPAGAWRALAGRWVAPFVATIPIGAASAALIIFAGGMRAQVESLGDLVAPGQLLFGLLALAISALAAAITGYWCAVAAATVRRVSGRATG